MIVFWEPEKPVPNLNKKSFMKLLTKVNYFGIITKSLCENNNKISYLRV